MLDIINCEPYGNIKHDPDDLDNIIINEVEDIEQITEDIEILEVGKIEVKNNINIGYIKIKEAEQIINTEVKSKPVIVNEHIITNHMYNILRVDLIDDT